MACRAKEKGGSPVLEATPSGTTPLVFVKVIEATFTATL